MHNNYRNRLRNGCIPQRKTLKKLGTVKISVVETTPVVWKGRLLRFEWTRNHAWGAAGGVTREVGCYRLVDMSNEQPLCEFADDHAFGCCYCDGEKMYAHGVRGPGGGNVIDTFVSDDLKSWQQSEAIVLPENIKIFNTSVCKADEKYVMAIEIGGDDPIVGKGFTCVFAESRDLINWTMMDTMECSYSRDRYTACPCIRYYDGYYYIICLESLPFHRWLPYIARSRDLKIYELGDINPIMFFDNDDKNVIHPERFTAEELDYIENAIDCNHSDVDRCNYGGKTVLTYSWGNQLGKEFLALAEYEGTEEEFLRSFFI